MVKAVERVESGRNGSAALLSPKQEAAALELARGASFVETAKTVDAGTNTVKTWATLPHFNQRIAELRAELTERVFVKLVDGMSEAVETLRKLMKSKSEAMRLKACETMLSHGSNAIELRALRQDVEELKRMRDDQ